LVKTSPEPIAATIALEMIGPHQKCAEVQREQTEQTPS
jgi:hypothetical protein